MAGLSYSFEALYPLDDGSGRRSARCSHHSRRQDLSRRSPEVQAGRRTRGRQTSGGKRERNDRIFAVPDRSPLETDLKDIRNLPSRALKELEFFRATNALENKDLKFLGWRGPNHAAKTIKRLST
jgi:hypothetical protein